MFSLRTAIKALVKSEMELLRQMREFQRTLFSDRYLLATNVTISLSLSSLGDILEQQIERYTDHKASNVATKWDYIRTRNMAISGCSIGVICHFWYRFLDQRMPGRTIGVVMRKIVLDQLICSPLYISAFFVTLGILQQDSPQDIWSDVKAKAWRLYMAEWMIWPVAQFINFYWLPSRYRVFYDNLISLGYDVYTSRVMFDNDGIDS